MTDLKPATLNCTLACLKSVLRWADERSIPVHPAYRKLRGVRDAGPTQTKAWWDTREVDLALTAAAEVDRELKKAGGDAPAGTATLLIALGCLLGLRYAEITMMKWEDLDLDHINSRSQLPEPVARVVPRDGWIPKDGEARTIPIHSHLSEILRAHRQTTGWLLNHHKSVAKRGGTKRVYRFDPRRLWNRVLAKAVAMGAKAITPHGMRHSFASNLLMAGVSDVLVARWLGHADTSMVHSTYGHLLAYHGDINRMRFDPGGSD